ncbi:MAG: hypothetical protein JWQ25_2492 [Daejeonella sp.]|nr:hypothetical protein [Daejeonella sp.]
MAAAIKTNANLIVTNNLKDFPKEYLSSFGLSAKCADDFFTDIIVQRLSEIWYLIKNILHMMNFKSLIFSEIMD